MPGIAHNHFPLIVWREGEKRLWNPIHKKALKNRPEERVRLRIIEALVEAGWSKHRISTEEKLRAIDNPGGRTDIICYDLNFDPQILIECKAERVPISPEVAEQTARYNRTVEAPYLLMTNGHTDFWYRISVQNQPQQLDTPPDLLDFSQPLEKDFSYWQDRGFAGNKTTDADLQNWVTATLNLLWLGSDNKMHYIDFNNTPSDLPLQHYYFLHQIKPQHWIALSIVSTPPGGSRLIAVINRKNQNVGLLEVNLDLIASGTSPNATVYSENDPKNFDILDLISFEFQATSDEDALRSIPGLLNSAFDKLTHSKN